MIVRQGHLGFFHELSQAEIGSKEEKEEEGEAYSCTGINEPIKAAGRVLNQGQGS